MSKKQDNQDYDKLYDDVTHDMQNKLYAKYLRKMRIYRAFNLLGVVVFCVMLILILQQCGIV